MFVFRSEQIVNIEIKVTDPEVRLIHLHSESLITPSSSTIRVQVIDFKGRVGDFLTGFSKESLFKSEFTVLCYV